MLYDYRRDEYECVAKIKIWPSQVDIGGYYINYEDGILRENSPW